MEADELRQEILKTDPLYMMEKIMGGLHKEPTPSSRGPARGWLQHASDLQLKLNELMMVGFDTEEGVPYSFANAVNLLGHPLFRIGEHLESEKAFDPDVESFGQFVGLLFERIFQYLKDQENA